MGARLAPSQIRKIRELVAKGWTTADVARSVGCSVPTVTIYRLRQKERAQEERDRSDEQRYLVARIQQLEVIVAGLHVTVCRKCGGDVVAFRSQAIAACPGCGANIGVTAAKPPALPRGKAVNPAKILAGKKTADDPAPH